MVGSAEGRSGCGGVVAASAEEMVLCGGRRGLAAGGGSSGVPGASCPVPASSASPWRSFKGAGSGRRLISSVSWPSSGGRQLGGGGSLRGGSPRSVPYLATKFWGGFGL
jgi:hypothetical protein